MMLSWNEFSQLYPSTPTHTLSHPLSETQQKHTPEWYQHVVKTHGIRPTHRFITMAALKGGIGKTFLSTHVAVRAAMMGFRVLLVDLDPEACAGHSLLPEETFVSSKKKTIYEVLRGLCSYEEAIIPTKYPLLSLLPSSLRVTRTEKIIMGKNPKTLLRKALETLPYDLIFLELPPSFSTLSTAAYLASDLVVIPCIPNIHSLESVDLTLEAIKEAALEFEVPLMERKILLNMFRSQRVASQDVYHILKQDYAGSLLPICISESSDVLNAINGGKTIYELPHSKSKLREELDQLLKHLLFSQTTGTSLQRSTTESQITPEISLGGHL
jgi:chromosome partitioning protein